MRLKHRLFLVRHGQAQGNRHGAFLGRTDDPLTADGIDQAKALAARIASESVDIVVASPLERASHTARILTEGRELPLSLDARLVEQDYGTWDGLAFAEIAEKRVEEFSAWWQGDPAHAPGGGESLVAVAARVLACYRSFSAGLPRGGTLMLVGHAGASQALLCGLLEVSLRNRWPFMLAPGTLAEVQVYDHGARLTRLSW